MKTPLQMDSNFHLDHENAERILQEGWCLFQQKGYRGVTVDEICQQCELSKPTLYYYFHDKENLFVQVLKFKLSGFREVIEQPGTINERLQRITSTILESFQNENSMSLLHQEKLKKTENTRKIREAFRNELFGPLFSLMKSGINQGELKEDNPEMLTLVFLGIINNFIGKAEEMNLENSALAKKLTDHFLEGAKKQ
ncbi:MAG: TetR/AcrR family transcriptional regulator [Anaerolineaceae bacterium]|nr:TetR/AcrR family transcriptional regulator [Anaerolineaceae bacterium]